METINNEGKNEAINIPKVQEREHSKEMVINPTVAIVSIDVKSYAGDPCYSTNSFFLSINNHPISIDSSDKVFSEDRSDILFRIQKYIEDNPSIVTNGLDLLVVEYWHCGPCTENDSEFLHFKYNKNLKKFTQVNTLPSRSSYKVTPIQSDTPVCIISEKKEKHSQELHSLYSIKEGKIISPKFKKLISKETETGTIFMFQDVVSSNITNKENNVLLPALQTEIIGFISPEGTFYNGVYDDYFNVERMTELNSQPDFLQYNELKQSIAKDLDEEAKRIQKHIAIFETKVKRKHYGKKD